MTKKIKVQTPAKINLSLEIVDRTENGFHTLSSVMQSVSLFDFLTISLTDIRAKENEIILRGNSPVIPYNEKNIIHKAISAYFSAIGANSFKVEVDIEKNIPVEAGLAGGSTNAAGALIAINELFNNELPNAQIHKIAASLGSDLNFCLEGGACVLSSRGEIIEEKLPYKEFDLLIAKPKNLSISTAQCYKEFSARYFEKKEGIYSKKIVELFKSEDFSSAKLAGLFYNDLEKPAIDNHPEICEIKELLSNSGCTNSLMSGSGSSVFGIFEGGVEIPNNENLEIFKVKSTPKGVELI